MNNNNIISLEETAPDFWMAKYQGNYGVYTIKMKLNGNKIGEFSCSCPSVGFPCKHLGVMQNAIAEQKAASKNEIKKETISVKDIINKTSDKELRDFIISYAPHNPELASKIQLEFLYKLHNPQENNYAIILRKALQKEQYDLDDLYDYDDSTIDIGILDEWFDKAQANIRENKMYPETLLIIKACIEEYADWLQGIDDDVAMYLNTMYKEHPFVLFNELINADNHLPADVFDYCIAEQAKEKYKDTGMFDGFQNLLQLLANTAEQQSQFIQLQDGLLNKISQKNTVEAERIFKRKIEFYNRTDHPEKAEEIIKNNIQIESFRKIIVEQKIAGKELGEAKKLVMDFLAGSTGDYYYSQSDWKKLLLDIAFKENDVPAVREISFSFIDNYFQPEYFQVYKSTFLPEEWTSHKKELIHHYQKNKPSFSDSVAQLMAEEKDAATLLEYVSKYPAVENINKYHPHFCRQYPAATIQLFQQSINLYVANNTGRKYYEHITEFLLKIDRIDGGTTIAKSMIAQFKMQYKNRSALIEILDKVKL